MRWMKLEAIIQSEISKKKKKYSMLMHIYGIYKDGNDDPICETVKETCKEQTVGLCGRRQGRDDLREEH